MTKQEFTGQFARLCKGFTHIATEEQTEAWYRRIGHVGISVWSESVTTLLCAKYFPKLDDVLAVIESEAEAQRRAAVQRDQRPAKKIYTVIQTGSVPGLNTPLFNAIKTFSAREQVRRYLKIIPKNDDREPRQREHTMAELQHEDDRLTDLLAKLLPQLEESDLSAFMTRYGAAVAA